MASLIAVGRGDVVRDTTDRPSFEQSYPATAELSRRLKERTAEEIVLEKARSGGYDETEPGEDDSWEFGGGGR